MRASFSRFLSIALCSFLFHPIASGQPQEKGQVDEAFLRKLEAEYQELLRVEKNPQPIREAAALLAKTNQSDNWTAYMGATHLLRRHRSKAAIPLLMQYMIRHAEFGGGNGNVAEYVDTLAVLTGENIVNPYRYVADRVSPVQEGVEKLHRTWWTPNKNKITVEPEKMTASQREIVADKLLSRFARSSRHNRGGRDSISVYDLSSAVRDILQPGGEPRGRLEKEPVHSALLPAILASAGYRPDDTKPNLPERRLHELLPSAVPMLAALRRDGAAPALDRLAEDKKLDSLLRLTCVLALTCAGEELKTSVLMSVIDSDPKVEHRTIAVLALAYAASIKPALPLLLKRLEDPNRDVRTAAVHVFAAHPTADALPRLKPILENVQPPEAIHVAFRAVGGVQTKEAKEMLANFLEQSLKDGKKGRYLYHALSAFEDATGRRSIEAGAHEEAYYREKAQLALEWWKKQRP
jgi:hypothetical protein